MLCSNYAILYVRISLNKDTCMLLVAVGGPYKTCIGAYRHIGAQRGVTIHRTGQHRTAPNHTGPTPDRTGPVPGRKWLIISLRQLLRVELRHNSEPTVLGLQLNQQETLNTSVTNSSRASTRVHFFSQVRIISSSYAFYFVVEVK